MKEKEVVFGMDFEQRRKKVKKNQDFFKSLNNKDLDENEVEQMLSVKHAPLTKESKEELPSLPLGLLK